MINCNKTGRIFTAAVSVVMALALAVLPGCGGKNESRAIRYDIDSGVTLLDPQFATDTNAVMIITNCFEGLLRRAADGTVEPGVAESYTVSADGRVYIFTLREDAVWSDGVAVTANDFVFAFRRIFDEESPSPYAAQFASIAGAAERLGVEEEKTEDTAEADDAQQDTRASAADSAPTEDTEPAALPELGVLARDARTLVITLAEANPGFPEKLTSVAASPCREDFFEATMGKYARAISQIVFNGAFTVTGWDNAKEITLAKNESYADAAQVSVPEVRLYIGKKDTRDRFTSGKTDFYQLTYDDSELLGNKKYTSTTVENQIWALVMNEGNALFANDKIRRALASAIDFDDFTQSGRTPDKYGVTRSLVAPAAIVGGELYSAVSPGAASIAYDPEQAAALFAAGLAELGVEAPASITMLVPESSGLAEFSGWLQKQWLESLNLLVNISVISDAKVSSALRSGDYQLALELFSSSSSGPEGTLSAFASDSSANVTGYSSAVYDRLVRYGIAQSDTARKADYFTRAEQQLLSEAVAVPFFTQSSYYASGKGVSGIAVFPDGELSFRTAFRK